MQSSRSLRKLSEFIFPLKFVLLDRKKSSMVVPAWPFIGLSLIILAFVGFVIKKFFPFIIPPCGFHKVTNIPCPTCGFTRMFFYILELNLKEAFLVQPFLFVLFLFLVLWVFACLIAFFFGKTLLIDIKPFYRKYLWIPLIFLFFLNWFYLIFRGI